MPSGPCDASSPGATSWTTTASGSDGEKFAFLFDVYVLPEHRGHGLGLKLVREAVDGGPHRDLPWYLKTRDAHGLYRKLGFGPPDVEHTMVRPPGGE